MTPNNKRLFFICISALLILSACDIINSDQVDKELEKLSVTGNIARSTDWFSFGWCETTEVISGQEYCRDNPSRFFTLAPDGGWNFSRIDGHFASEYSSNASGTLEVHYDMESTFSEEYINKWVLIGWARVLFTANEGENFGQLILMMKQKVRLSE